MRESLALEARAVSKRYGEHEALCNVDLVARPGELHGLLGPNGAGKTTLMRVLLGLVRRDGGIVRLLGRELDSISGPVPEGVAGLVETPHFYPYLSARKNLELLARLDTTTRAARRLRVTAVLEQTGLAADAAVAAGAYSAGMRQRLGLAAALLRSPQLLLLDEPTSALDPAAARDVRALARRLAADGAALVLSSHDMAEVEELCDTITVIDRGRVVFSGTVGAVRLLAPPAIHVVRTSDDRAALGLASSMRDLKVRAAAGGGLEISADVETLDAYVIALGRAGIAVRALEPRQRSLESLFLALTGDADTDEREAAAMEPTPDSMPQALMRWAPAAWRRSSSWNR